LRVPILVTVGGEDVNRERTLRRFARLDRQQGRNRLERARRWVEAMKALAEARALEPSVELVTLDGMHHSFSENVERGGLGELAEDFLFSSEHLARVRPAPEKRPADRPGSGGGAARVAAVPGSGLGNQFPAAQAPAARE
jgi:hypothetical protein